MTETPREIREKLILQWYEKKLNRDELLKVLEWNELLDKKVKKKIESEILKNFYENFEKAKEDEGFKSADAQYREIKRTHRQMDKKSEQLSNKRKSTGKDLQEIDKQMTDIAEIAMDLEDGSWWKKGKLRKANEKRNELETQQKRIQGEIDKLAMEKQSLQKLLHKLESEYGPKIERKIKRPVLELDKLNGIHQINGEGKSETTLSGYKEKYFQTLESIEEFMKSLLLELESMDLGIDEEKKGEVINLLKESMAAEIESLKKGDEIIKMADETEKWLEENWGVATKNLSDLSSKIEKKEFEIKELESKEQGANTEDLLEIREKEFEAKKELIELKNEYESTKTELTEKLKKHNGLDIDWTKNLEVETWKEKGEREKREQEEKLERERREQEEIERKRIEDRENQLDGYHQSWSEKIDIHYETAKKIVDACKKIPVNVKMDEEGSRLITLVLGDKKYEILDPILDNHTSLDENYSHFIDDGTETIIPCNRRQVYQCGMQGDDVDKWENGPLKKYVKQKMEEGLRIPSKNDIEELLKILGDMAGLKDEASGLAMLMYLTGLNGGYWLADETETGEWSVLFRKVPRFYLTNHTWRLNLLMLKVS